MVNLKLCLKKSIVMGIFIIIGMIFGENVLHAQENGKIWYFNERSEKIEAELEDVYENPQLSPEGNVLVGKKWEPGKNPYSITPDGDVVRAFTSRGWVWGAGYRRPDYMHFDFPTMSLDYSILEQLLK